MPIRVIKAPPERQDKLTQSEPSSLQTVGDFLRAASQPLSYLREIGEGNFLPTQAELESRGVSPVDMSMALFNPFDHAYAFGAEMDLFDDPNMGSSSRDPNVAYSTMGPIASLLLGSTSNRAQRIAQAPQLQEAANTLKKYGAAGLNSLDQSVRRKLREGAELLPDDLKSALGVFDDFDSSAARIGDELSDALPRYGYSPDSDQYFDPYRFSEWLKSNNPKLVLDYQAGNINSPEMSRAFREFSDQLLTSYRGVGVPIQDLERAKDAVVNPRGTAHHIYGEGRYSSPDLSMAAGYGGQGSVARVKSAAFPENARTTDMAFGLDNMYKEGSAHIGSSRPGEYLFMTGAEGKPLRGQENLDAISRAGQYDNLGSINIDRVPYRYGMIDKQGVRVTRSPMKNVHGRTVAPSSIGDFHIEDIVGVQDAQNLVRPTIFNRDLITGLDVSGANRGFDKFTAFDGSKALQDYTQGALFLPHEQLAGGLGLVSLDDLRKAGYTIPTKYGHGGKMRVNKTRPMRVMKR